MLVPSIIDAKYNPAKMQNPLAIPRFVESSTPKITHSILRRPRNIALAGVILLAVLAVSLTIVMQEQSAKLATRAKMDAILGGLGATNLDNNLMTEVSQLLTNEVIVGILLEANNTGADNGDASAMNNLGTHYQQGLGVPQDYGKARGWYEKAADKGN